MNLQVSLGSSDTPTLRAASCAIRFSDIRSRYILWFRPEIVRTVNWAGSHQTTRREQPSASNNVFCSMETDSSYAESPLSSTGDRICTRVQGGAGSISLRRLEEEAALSSYPFNKLAYALR